MLTWVIQNRIFSYRFNEYKGKGNVFRVLYTELGEEKTERY
jgi:hypothetical protein